MTKFSTCLDRNRNNKDKCMFLLYIHANAVNNNKGNTSSGEQTSGLSMEFSIKVHVLCGSQRTFSAASYPDVSLSMKMCAQRRAGRRRLHPSHGSLRFITSRSPLPLTASTLRKTKRLKRRLHILRPSDPTFGSFETTLAYWKWTFCVI